MKRLGRFLVFWSVVLYCLATGVMFVTALVVHHAAFVAIGFAMIAAPTLLAILGMVAYLAWVQTVIPAWHWAKGE